MRRPFEGGTLLAWTEVHKSIQRIRARVVQHDPNVVMDVFQECAELEHLIGTLEQLDNSIPKNIHQAPGSERKEDDISQETSSTTN